MLLPLQVTPALMAAFRAEIEKGATSPVEAAEKVVEKAAPGLAGKKNLLKGVAIAGGGALAYDQGTKAVSDWKSGREMRRQQNLYR